MATCACAARFRVRPWARTRVSGGVKLRIYSVKPCILSLFFVRGRVGYELLRGLPRFHRAACSAFSWRASRWVVACAPLHREARPVFVGCASRLDGDVRPVSARLTFVWCRFIALLRIFALPAPVGSGPSIPCYAACMPGRSVRRPNAVRRLRVASYVTGRPHGPNAAEAGCRFVHGRFGALTLAHEKGQPPGRPFRR